LEKLIYAVADIDAMKAHAAQRKPEADVEIADEHANDMKTALLRCREREAINCCFVTIGL
jgi:hypothetical protein